MDELAFRQPELVGRDNELGMLKKALTDASSEKGSTIFVSGEPGIGKTRLVEEFRKHAESAGVRILSGAAMSGSAHPFQIFSKALEGISFEPLFEESEYTSFAEIFAVNSAGLLLGKASSEEGGLDADIFAGMLSAVQDFVRDSFGQGGEKAGLGRLEYGDMKILIEHGHYMFLTAVFSGAEHPDMKNTLKQTLQKVEESHGQLIEKWTGNLSDIKPVQDEIEKLSGARFLVRKDLEGVKLENERLKIADRVLETLARLSGEKPLVMFLEDLHWADESSLFVLNYLARNIRKARVLLLGTLRQRESDVLQKAIENMKNEEIMNEMALENLDFKNTVSFIDRTYSPNDFSGTLAERLYEQSKGNPLFVTEMLKGMLADGNIVKADGRYSLVSESYNVPTTVEEVINGRLEFLDPDSMAMVEYASCIGQKFDVSLAASSRLTKDPDAALEKLLASGILLRKNGAIEFSHAVFQNVIYDSIGERWKNGHHRNLGEYFEINYADRLDEVIYDLAWHFSRTKEYQKCSDYCIGAGEKAEDSFAVEQALEFYNWALAALSKLDITEAKDRSLNISERAGDLRSLMGKYDEAIGNFMTVKEKADDKEIKARMLRKVGEVRTSKGEFEGSLEVLAEAKELAEVDTAEYGRIIFAEGYSYLRKGDYDKAMSLSSEAVNIAEKAGTDKKDIGKALRAIGMIYHSKGDYDTALQYFEKSLAVMEEIGEEYGIASVLNNIGVVYKIKGELDKALEFYERSLEIKERIGDKQGVAMSLGNIGNVHWNRGDMERALESHERSLEIKEKIGDKLGAATSLNNIGALQHDSGELDRALEFCERGLEIREKIGDKQGAATSLNNIGLIHHNRGELDRALDIFRHSLDMNEEIGDKYGIAFSLNNLGLVHWSKGELDLALKYYENCLAICLEIGNKRPSIYPHCGLVEVELEKGDTGAAFEHAKNAVEISVDIGAKPEEGMSHRVLGMVHREMKDLDRASEEFSKAEKILREASEIREPARLNYEHALLSKAKNEPAKAKEYFDKALAEFERMGMKLWADKCRTALQELK